MLPLDVFRLRMTYWDVGSQAPTPAHRSHLPRSVFIITLAVTAVLSPCPGPKKAMTGTSTYPEVLLHPARPPSCPARPSVRPRQVGAVARQSAARARPWPREPAATGSRGGPGLRPQAQQQAWERRKPRVCCFSPHTQPGPHQAPSFITPRYCL